MRPDGLSDIANVLSHTGKAADFVADYLNDRLQYHAEAAKAASLPAQAAEVVSKLEDLKSAFDATREWSVEVEERLTVVVFGLSNGCSIELLDERDEPHVRSSDWELLLRSGAPSHLPLLERLVVPEYPVNTYLGTKWEFQRWGEQGAPEPRLRAVAAAAMFFAAAVHGEVEDRAAAAERSAARKPLATRG